MTTPQLTDNQIHGLTQLAESINGRMIDARTFDALRRRDLAALRYDTAQHTITEAGLAALQHYAQTPRGSIRARRALWNLFCGTGWAPTQVTTVDQADLTRGDDGSLATFASDLRLPPGTWPLHIDITTPATPIRMRRAHLLIHGGDVVGMVYTNLIRRFQLVIYND